MERPEDRRRDRRKGAARCVLRGSWEPCHGGKWQAGGPVTGDPRVHTDQDLSVGDRLGSRIPIGGERWSSDSHRESSIESGFRILHLSRAPGVWSHVRQRPASPNGGTWPRQ